MRALKISLVLILLYVLWMVVLRAIGLMDEDRVWVYIVGLPFLLSPGFLITQLFALSSNLDASFLGTSGSDPQQIIFIHLINVFFLFLLGMGIDKLLKIRRHWHETRPY